MPPYSGPSKERASYASKFIRVESDVFVTNPGDLDTLHGILAQKDGVLERIEDIRFTNPAEVDAGTFDVIKDEILGDLIQVRGDSMTLRLPVKGSERLARERTGVIFQQQSPNHEVVTSNEELRKLIDVKFNKRYGSI